MQLVTIRDWLIFNLNYSRGCLGYKIQRGFVFTLIDLSMILEFSLKQFPAVDGKRMASPLVL